MIFASNLQERCSSHFLIRLNERIQRPGKASKTHPCQNAQALKGPVSIQEHRNARINVPTAPRIHDRTSVMSSCMTQAES